MHPKYQTEVNAESRKNLTRKNVHKWSNLPKKAENKGNCRMPVLQDIDSNIENYIILLYNLYNCFILTNVTRIA
jgi:hypothetical protein